MARLENIKSIKCLISGGEEEVCTSHKHIIQYAHGSGTLSRLDSSLSADNSVTVRAGVSHIFAIVDAEWNTATKPQSSNEQSSNYEPGQSSNLIACVRLYISVAVRTGHCARPVTKHRGATSNHYNLTWRSSNRVSLRWRVGSRLPLHISLWRRSLYMSRRWGSLWWICARWWGSLWWICARWWGSLWWVCSLWRITLGRGATSWRGVSGRSSFF